MKDEETKRPNSSIRPPIGTAVCAMESSIWRVRAEEACNAWERRAAAAEPQPCGAWGWGSLQPWPMPCLMPLGQFSSGAHCISREEAIPSLAQGSGGSPRQRDSSLVQWEPGSCVPAFCPGSQKPEALVGEEEPRGAPRQPVLQQPPCIWNPRQGAPQQEAQNSHPGPSGQRGEPAAPSWWRACPVVSALLEWIPCPALPTWLLPCLRGQQAPWGPCSLQIKLDSNVFSIEIKKGTH